MVSIILQVATCCDSSTYLLQLRFAEFEYVFCGNFAKRRSLSDHKGAGKYPVTVVAAAAAAGVADAEDYRRCVDADAPLPPSP